MKSVKLLLAAVCVAGLLCGQAALAAQAPAASPLPPPQPQSQSAQTPLLPLGPGDQVRVEVYGLQDLTTITNVSDDGSIRMPLAGAVSVIGQSPAEAARRIEKALKDGQFVVDPHATVTVVESLTRRVTVIGEVATPGLFPVQSNSTVLDVIALAGGLTPRASDVITILRPDAAGNVQQLTVNLRDMMTLNGGKAIAVQTLQGGDKVVVPLGTFFITGQVVTPGEYRIEGEMVLLQAIARAGGITQMGSASRVEVRRRGPDGKFVEMKGKKDMRIQLGDVITVKERWF